MTSASNTISALKGFQLIRVLDQDAKQRTASLLGYFPSSPSSTGVSSASAAEEAIVLLEKTHFSPDFFSTLGDRPPKLTQLGQNDIYSWFLAWSSRNEERGEARPDQGQGDADMKINIIRPATEAHVKKYERQQKMMVYETPEMYETKVKPWIDSQPASRTNWVYNILDGKKETESVIFRSPSFILLPDLKWDRKTLASLYLIAIVQDRSLQSLRDLTKAHVPLLESIRDTAAQVAQEKYALRNDNGDGFGVGGKLRCFIHYQPSYYHLHIHILSSDYTSHPGAIVGQAHLLEDVIDLLKMGVDFKRRTLGYALGRTHELYEVLSGAGTSG